MDAEAVEAMSRRNRRAAIIGKQIENSIEINRRMAARPDDVDDWTVGYWKREAAKQSWAVGRDPDELRRLASLCGACGEPGHHKRACPSIVCRACQGLGHKASKCPNKATS